MSAPLYSRYRRYADREAGRFPKTSLMGHSIPLWKRPDTRVYSLTDRASHEAGWWSGEDPGEILRSLSMHYLPMPQVWIELDWLSYNRGTNRLPLESEKASLVVGSRGWEPINPENFPVRLGVMLFQPQFRGKLIWSGIPGGTVMGFLFYLYPTGACFVGPPIFAWHPTLPVGKDIRELPGSPMKNAPGVEEVAMGTSYFQRHGKQQPRLAQKLKERTLLTVVGGGAGYSVSWSEIDGTTRLAIAALTAALSAKPPVYAPDETKTLREAPAKPAGERNRPIEVDLFIRERPRRPGASIKASVGHLEGIKKGLHTVAAHYAYRLRPDGSDPTLCDRTPTKAHDFEDIDGTKSQVCVFCGQRRWFRDRHQRGDEAYGIVPPKTYNVRLGAPRALTEGTE